MDSLNKGSGHALWIVYYNAAEADVDRGRSCVKKGGEIGWGSVLRGVAEKETADIF